MFGLMVTLCDKDMKSCMCTGDTHSEHHRQVLHRCLVQPDATLLDGLLVVLYGLASEFTLEHFQEALPNPPTFAVSLEVKVVRIHFSQASFKVVGGLIEVLLAEADPRVPLLRRGDVSLAPTEVLPAASSPSLPSPFCLGFVRLVAFAFACLWCLFLRGFLLCHRAVYLRRWSRDDGCLLHRQAAQLTPWRKRTIQRRINAATWTNTVF